MEVVEPLPVYTSLVIALTSILGLFIIWAIGTLTYDFFLNHGKSSENIPLLDAKTKVSAQYPGSPPVKQPWVCTYPISFNILGHEKTVFESFGVGCFPWDCGSSDDICQSWRRGLLVLPAI